MKHFALLVVIAVVGYTLWQFTSRRERTTFAKLATHHALRLGAIIFVIALLLAAAVYFPASPLL